MTTAYDKLQRFLTEVKLELKPHPQMEHVSDKLELRKAMEVFEITQLSVIKTSSGYLLRMATTSLGSRSNNGFATNKIYIDRNWRPYIRVFNNGKMTDIFLSPRS